MQLKNTGRAKCIVCSTNSTVGGATVRPSHYVTAPIFDTDDVLSKKKLKNGFVLFARRWPARKLRWDALLWTLDQSTTQRSCRTWALRELFRRQTVLTSHLTARTWNYACPHDSLPLTSFISRVATFRVNKPEYTPDQPVILSVLGPLTLILRYM